MQLPPQIDDLISRLSALPGLGKKSATRLALHILKRPQDEVEALSQALTAVKREIHFCSLCHDYTNSDPCPRCADPSRDHSSLCVVETPADLLVMESSGLYRGLYHVLGGVLNPLQGVGPDELNISDLIDRLSKTNDNGEGIKELILATGSSPEAETTCSYILDRLKGRPLKVTRLARGIPSGMDLEFVDTQTLREAISHRHAAR
ncbi:MAG: recombination mediator RecR [Deltaproteobacteria bacterium]|jgi:recombination protein RecR|nr:recombination mediator RecR [Deltaproteobacteria bacterium]